MLVGGEYTSTVLGTIDETAQPLCSSLAPETSRSIGVWCSQACHALMACARMIAQETPGATWARDRAL